jgi:hypothetical protein
MFPTDKRCRTQTDPNNEHEDEGQVAQRIVCHPAPLWRRLNEVGGEDKGDVIERNEKDLTARLSPIELTSRKMLRP